MIGRAANRRVARVLEVAGGVFLALVFFLVLLWILNMMFPRATVIGDLVRYSDTATEARGDATVYVVDDEEIPVVAVLTGVRRSVKAKAPRSVTWADAREGASLEERHAVQSYSNSGATISFDDHNKLTLGENSLVIVRSVTKQARTNRKRASVIFLDGELHGRMPRSDDGSLDLEVMAAGSAIRASSGSDEAATFALNVREDQSATLSVYEGSAEVFWGGEVVRVGSDHSVDFDLSRPPSRPRRLPPTPTPRTPGDGEEVVYRTVSPKVQFDWTGASVSPAYRFLIARDPGFERVVHEERTSEPFFVHGHLKAGDYYWRVSGVDGTAEGRPSAARRLAVRVDREPPALRVDFPEATVRTDSLLLAGNVEPGSRVVVDGNEVPTGDSGEFRHELRLRHGYNFVVVQAIDPSGNTTFRSSVITGEF